MTNTSQTHWPCQYIRCCTCWLLSYYYKKVCVFWRWEEACDGSEGWRRSAPLLSSSKIMSFKEASSWRAAPAIEHCGRIPKRSKVRELDVMELRCNPFLLDLLWELGTLSLSLSLRERERERERDYCNGFLLHESFRLIYIDPRARERKAVLRSISSSWESEIDLSPREREIRHR
jgi:hypothetical protein